MRTSERRSSAGLVLLFGRIQRVAGPGVVVALPPPINEVITIDLRERTWPIRGMFDTRDGRALDMAIL